MAAPEDVKRYFRQLKEQGETELTFPTLSAESLRRASPGAHTSGSSESAEIVMRSRGATKQAAAVPAVDEHPPVVSESDMDWRAALRQGESIVSSVTRDIFSAPGALASLTDVATAVASCTRCALHQAARNPVPGEGNADADLICVGEGPGASEDESGRPFVGAAGKLLNDILAAIRLARDDVYICNVVKHRPPGNRTPFPDEIAACSTFLSRQIELVQPRVILALGATAAQTLLNSRLSLGKLRGAVHTYNGVPLIVTYHPAALLRNPAWKRPTWEDVQIVRRILDGAAIV